MSKEKKPNSDKWRLIAYWSTWKKASIVWILFKCSDEFYFYHDFCQWLLCRILSPSLVFNQNVFPFFEIFQHRHKHIYASFVYDRNGIDLFLLLLARCSFLLFSVYFISFIKLASTFPLDESTMFFGFWLDVL